MKRGFTLIELSIVLVVVGLLISGILIAQSVISATRTTKLVAAMDQYESVIKIFKETYKALPGDYQGCPPDGIVGHYINDAGTYLTPGCAGGEWVKFWTDLRETDAFVEANIAPGAHGAVLPDMPRAIFGGQAGVHVAHSTIKTNGGGGLYLQKGNLLMAIDISNPAGGFLTAEESLSYDTKMDDGKPGTGNAVIWDGFSNNCVTDGGGNYGYAAWPSAASSITIHRNGFKGCIVSIWLDKNRLY